MKEKIDILRGSLADFKVQIDEQIKQQKGIGYPNNLFMVREKRDPRGDVKLYAINQAASSQTIPSIQSAYNLATVLDHIFELVQKQSYTLMFDNKARIQKEVMVAIESFAPDDKNMDMVVDDVTAQLAQGWSRFFAKASDEFKSLGSISSAIVAPLSWATSVVVKAAMTLKLKKREGETQEKTVAERINEDTPGTLDALSKFFAIAEHSYRVKQLSEKINPIAIKQLVGNSEEMSRIRQELLSILPTDQQKGLPNELNEKFLIEYQTQCNLYQNKIVPTDASALRNLKSNEIVARFVKEQTGLQNNFLSLFERVNTLITAVINSSSKEATQEKELPLNIIQEPVEDVVKEKPKEEEPVAVSEATSPSIENNELEEVKFDDPNEDDPIKIIEKVLKENADKINELKQEIVILDNKFNQLDQTIVNLNAQKKQKQESLEPITETIAQLEQELTNKPELEKTRDTLGQQLSEEPTAESIEEEKKETRERLTSLELLRKEIDEDKLTFDSEKDQRKIGLLGVNEQAIKSYLVLQEEENSLVNKAYNFFSVLLTDTTQQPIDEYKKQKQGFLNALGTEIEKLNIKETTLKAQKVNEEKIKELQEKLINLDKEISSLTSKTTELEILKTQTLDLEKEIAFLTTTINENTTEQDRVDQQRNILSQRIGEVTEVQKQLQQKLQENQKQEEAVRKVEEASPEEKVLDAIFKAMLEKKRVLVVAKNEFLTSLRSNQSSQETSETGKNVPQSKGIGEVLKALDNYIEAWKDYKAAWKDYKTALKNYGEGAWNTIKTKWKEHKIAEKDAATSEALKQEEKLPVDNKLIYPPIPPEVGFFSHQQKEPAPANELNPNATSSENQDDISRSKNHPTN